MKGSPGAWGLAFWGGDGEESMANGFLALTLDGIPTAPVIYCDEAYGASKPEKISFACDYIWGICDGMVGIELYCAELSGCPIIDYIIWGLFIIAIICIIYGLPIIACIISGFCIMAAIGSCAGAACFGIYGCTGSGLFYASMSFETMPGANTSLLGYKDESSIG